MFVEDLVKVIFFWFFFSITLDFILTIKQVNKLAVDPSAKFPVEILTNDELIQKLKQIEKEQRNNFFKHQSVR